MRGEGGVGKSVLAAAVARLDDVRREFPDGVYWLTVGQDPVGAGVEVLRDLAKRVGAEAGFRTASEGRVVLQDALAGRRVLVVGDDVWEPGVAQALNVVSGGCWSRAGFVK